jgi:hypothetical protein
MGFQTPTDWTDVDPIDVDQLDKYSDNDQWNHDCQHAKEGSTLTISSGVITVTGDEGFYYVSGESGADDDLATINGHVDGDIIILAYDDDTISFVDTGNIDIGEGGIPPLGNAGEMVCFRYNGNTSKWEVMWWNNETEIGEIMIPVGAMNDENGSEPGEQEIVDVGTMCYPGVPFDPDALEILNTSIVLPQDFDGGDIDVTFYWTATTTGSGAVRWGAIANGVGNDDDLDTTPGSASTVDDTFLLVNDLHISPAVSVTPGNSPEAGDLMSFRIYRSGASGNDTFGEDAYLLCVKIEYTKKRV